ncbi:MAG: Dipeptide-binding ABC transporter, periplasmic substrate-binding component (TC 3.A.1.5.2) [uncultured Sulfurovum sp.]|uniref:Dipeptide-binding ABC transporter, periplasmic substrate-binding component (TC 3.A.1.5.2) n=1 Tax=uncultured Sulfurovum sp. TaxID=269237 RepID=A0A6S6SEX9_9BACT|nr:MAG: Dipeptide-binding ABC transporter, periplasmic substrate-binding component (TC 3.A.1.5.2) [uncultured Sulfurovum sp.]
MFKILVIPCLLSNFHYNNGMKKLLSLIIYLLFSTSLYANVWNSPHNAEKRNKNTLFSSFNLAYKNLDPVRSYSKRESVIISHIYEPVVGYNFLKRPYVLEPLTLTKMPEIIYLDKNKKEVKEESKEVAFSKYTFSLQKGILYQNHPCFVEENRNLKAEQFSDIDSLDNFENVGTRTLTADDYAYAIKRMAVRQNNSPILDTIQTYIVGLEDFSKEITKVVKEKKKNKEKVDLKSYKIEGVKVLDEQTFSILIKGKYPQFLYWMSMNFFAPIPWEAELFYAQKELIAKNITLNTSPIGTGAYYLAENNPNKQVRLAVNSNYRDVFYPTLTKEEIEQSNVPKELLEDAGKKVPFINEVVYSLEKEGIPLWNKFLQGYYDASGISSEAFDKAISVSSVGEMGLSDEMAKKGVKLKGSVEPSIFYLAFNMLDPVVGGYSESAKKLRQAISIAQNEEEYISIFSNERGIAAQSPIPPSIFGHVEGQEGTNPFVYDWIDGERVRKSLTVAKRLLTEAGYPNGISEKTGKALVLNYDTTGSGPDQRATMDWRRKQFSKLGIQLVIRATDYNRFQDKVNKGKAQLFSWGWNADYPDPENFLFLLYGKNGAVDTNGAGVNSANYKNPKFDKLFHEMKTMEDSPQRLEIIKEMIAIVQEDAPWVWGVHPKSLALHHEWFKNIYPHAMSDDTLKYKRIDAKLRTQKQEEWNQPVFLPLVLFFLVPLLLAYPLYSAYQRRQKAVVKGGN